MSLNRSNSPFTFFKAAFYANIGALSKRSGSSSYASRNVFRKSSDTSVSNNVLL